MTMVAHLKTTTKLGELVWTKQFDKYLIRYPPMSSWIQYLDIKILTLTKTRCLDKVNSLLEVNMDEPPTLTKLGLFYSQFGNWLGEKCTFLLNNFNCEKYIGPRWWCRGWGGIIWQRALTWRNPESSDGSWEQWAGTFSICISMIIIMIVILKEQDFVYFLSA